MVQCGTGVTVTACQPKEQQGVTVPFATSFVAHLSKVI